jgi:pimeloyl-ACP methyl ester carboxylesterase
MVRDGRVDAALLRNPFDRRGPGRRAAGERAPGGVPLLHGFPDSSKRWRHEVPVLVEAGFRVIAPDLRGFGESDKPEGVERYALREVLGTVGTNLVGGGIEQRRRSWYMLWFKFPGVAEEALPRDDWRLFREWMGGKGDIERWIADLSRPGALTVGLNWYRSNIQPELFGLTEQPDRGAGHPQPSPARVPTRISAHSTLSGDGPSGHVSAAGG